MFLVALFCLCIWLCEIPNLKLQLDMHILYSQHLALPSHLALHCCAVLPGRLLAMLLHWLPWIRSWSCSLESSTSVQASLVMVGSRCLFQRPMHCWSVRPCVRSRKKSQSHNVMVPLSAVAALSLCHQIRLSGDGGVKVLQRPCTAEMFYPLQKQQDNWALQNHHLTVLLHPSGACNSGTHVLLATIHMLLLCLAPCSYDSENDAAL